MGVKKKKKTTVIDFTDFMWDEEYEVKTIVGKGINTPCAQKNKSYPSPLDTTELR